MSKYYIAKYKFHETGNKYCSIIKQKSDIVFNEILCITFIDELNKLKDILQEKLLPLLINNSSNIAITIKLSTDELNLLDKIITHYNLEIFNRNQDNKLINKSNTITLTLLENE